MPRSSTSITSKLRRVLISILGLSLLALGILRDPSLGSFSIAQAQTVALTIPAFPGAIGFGSGATGGRGGQVIYVTTLDPDGAGSLAEALATPGKRTILFKVSGVINVAAEIIYGDVTIAGQSSPGEITVRGLVCDGHYDVNKCDNLIIRHLRSRPASQFPSENYLLDDALRLDGVENVIVDHLSLANATDEEIQISMARNITIQNTILAETIGEHHTFGGMLFNYSRRERPQDNITIYRNMWHRISGRTPEFSCEFTRGFGADDAPEIPALCSQQPLHVELSNNLLWDPSAPIIHNDNVGDMGQPDVGVFALNLNYQNNYWVVRPDYPFGMMTATFINEQKNTLFVAGNRMNIYPDFSDFQLAYCCNDFPTNAPNSAVPAVTVATQRLPYPSGDLLPADQVTAWMIENVGAFPRDPMDQRFIASLVSGKIDPIPHDVPGALDALSLAFDPKNPPEAPLNSNSDGIPDAWEIANGLNPQAADNNGTELSESLTGIAGYTNLEVYLNQLADSLIK